MTKTTEFSWVEVIKKVDPDYDRSRQSYEFNGKSFYSPKKKRNARSRKS